MTSLEDNRCGRRRREDGRVWKIDCAPSSYKDPYLMMRMALSGTEVAWWSEGRSRMAF
jgi:hypothetical protein